jgi:D-lactate dehydrogenase (cytochrome)
MPNHRLPTRPPRGARTDRPRWLTDPRDLAPFLEDAAHFPGGRAKAVAEPRSEAEVADVLRQSRHVLPIGAQSSLTGGATPVGEVVLSTARMAAVLRVSEDEVEVEAGVSLAVLEATLRRRGLWYPPVPTFTGALAGGVVATNAAGAATFKYGSTRDWVRGLTVVLASGEVLDLARGEAEAHPDGYFEIETATGTIRVPVPTYHMPDVPKRSTGYYAAPGMDLIDLFIGSEGTLGVITRVAFAVRPEPPGVALALIPARSERQALALVHELREASKERWRSGDLRQIDVAAIEHMDRRCLELIAEDGEDRRHRVRFPLGTQLALLVQLELPADLTPPQAYDEIARALATPAPDTPLARFCRLCHQAGVLDDVELALPADRGRAAQLLAVREAVPAGVNRRVAEARRLVHPAIEKTAADMIVPFPRFPEMLAVYRDGFGRRGLDYAIWGHVSDGNVHPNVIPHSLADVEAGKEAILEFGREVVRLGGCPLAEHGVGRNPVKQALLHRLYGTAGIEEMRRVKRALDPDGKLAPGVLVPPVQGPP